MKAHILQFASAVIASVLLTACDSAPPPPEVGYEDQPKTHEVEKMRQSPANKQKQADFLNRIRSADPQGKTIERALLNENNELGLILDRSVQLDDIPKLMRSMLTQMAKEFPGQDLTVIAYTPSNPPRKIGTARLEATSREMTYTPEK